MSNIYNDFFEVLKSYLNELEIDKKDNGISGCSEEELKEIETLCGDLPLAYKEYLKSIGKKFLFQFMDAEDMSYKDLDYIWNFGKEVFENNNTVIEKTHIIISERRNDYISLIYLNEGDDPKVWIMSEYWDEEDGENLTVRTNSFTELMLSFFSQTLRNHTAGFHFVTEKEVKDNKNIIEDRYIKWFKGLVKIKEAINNYNGKNDLVIKLNELFLYYYNANEEYINSELKNNKLPKTNNSSREMSDEDFILKSGNKKNNSILQIILNIFK